MISATARAALALGLWSAGSCLSGAALAAPTGAQEAPYQVGKAAWYGHPFHGRLTANGERFNMYRLTAAHRELPLGSVVRVTNLKNRRSVVVRINDRGPWDHHGRIIDLSYAASKALGMVRCGVAPVTLELLKRNRPLLSD